MIVYIYINISSIIPALIINQEGLSKQPLLNCQHRDPNVTAALFVCLRASKTVTDCDVPCPKLAYAKIQWLIIVFPSKTAGAIPHFWQWCITLEKKTYINT